MAEITAITPQKKDKKRCNIYVDGAFYCGMTLETVVKNRLRAGVVVDPQALSLLQLESEKMTALDKALTHISSSMKTEREIRTFLKKKGYLQDISDYVVEKMKEYGYLDDGAYAKSYTESAAKRKGSRLISAELKRKGVSDEEIRQAVDALEDETDSAFTHLEKYMRGKTADRATLQKAYRHLLSKGYDYDTAKAAMQKLGAEDED